MTNFDVVKTYEAVLVTSGFMQQEDLGAKVKMISFDDNKGSFVKTEDYNRLLLAYKEATAAQVTTESKEGTKRSKSK